MLSTALGTASARRRESMAGNGDKGIPTKPEWHAPKVDDIGNLRDFVKAGGGGIKTGTLPDGERGTTEKHKSD
jgi:hypothetical protein